MKRLVMLSGGLDSPFQGLPSKKWWLWATSSECRLKKRGVALPQGKPRVGHATLALPVKKPSLLRTLRP